MTIVKPHTLNRPMHELRQLRERPELIETLAREEMLRIVLYAVSAEEFGRQGIRPLVRNNENPELVAQG